MNFIKKINFFLAAEKHYSLLSALFLIYLGIFIFNKFFNWILLDLAQILGGIFFVFFGTGISATLILQWLIKKNFGKWEFASLAFLNSLLIPSVMLNAEFFVLGKAYDWYPVANSIFLWLSAGILLCLKRAAFPSLSFSPKTAIRHPLSIVFAFGFIFTLIQVLLYSTLPDLDPYKWLFKYTYQFANQQLDYIERPLFGSLIFIETRFANLSILTLFKYIFPFLYLLVLFPAWMVAETFQDKKKQFIFLLFVFVSPVAILYAQTAMPQAALIILSYFFTFFLIHAYLKKDDFFFYVAGITAFLSFFFHQSGIIAFSAWLIIFLIAKRKEIISDKKTFFFVILLVITNLPKLKPLYQFAVNWIEIIISRFFSSNNLNLFYPFSYRNIDNNYMGWGSLDGVFKFYAFHMGPIVATVLFLFLLMLVFNRHFRHFLKKNIGFNAPLGIIFFSFLVYFSIAEILPRFPNLALLPDRAWIFAGIFSFLFVFLILNYIKKIPSWSIYFLAFLFLINIFGATYVNYLKKFLITPSQIKSAKWIKENLKKDNTFISYGHKALLPVYADSSVIKIPAKIYCSKNIADYNSEIKKNSNTFERYESFLISSKKTIADAFEFYQNNPKNPDKRHADATAKINAFLEEATLVQKALVKKSKGMQIIRPLSYSPTIYSPILIENAYEQEKIVSLDQIKNSDFYIYYARQHDLNPYRGRPYEMSNWGIDPCPDGKFIFDLYPQNFKRVYSINSEEVIIWKVL